MKNIATRRIILSFVVVFLFLPNFISAELNPEELVKKQDAIELKKKESQKILESLTGHLTKKWEDTATLNKFSSEDNAAVKITLESIKINSLRYLMYDVGGDVLKETLEIAYLLLAQDPKLYIKKIEDYTVDKAKEYAMDWLLQKEMRIGKGNLNYAYPSFGGGWEAGKFPYIIVYRPIDLERGEVAIGIYSSKTIKTPEVTLDFQWEGGIYELPPFKVEIKGEVKEISGRYLWTKGPEIEIIFNEKVPEFEFKEPSVWDKVETSFNKVRNIVGKVFGIGVDKIEALVKVVKNTWNDLKIFFAGVNQQEASILSGVGIFVPEIVKQSVDQGVDMIWEEILETEEEIEKVDRVDGSEVSEKEIQEILDDIAERIDILTQQVADLLPDEPAFAEVTAAEEEYEEKEESEEEQEVTESLSAKSDSVTLVTKRSSRGSPPAPEPSYCSLASLEEPIKDKVIFDEIGWMGTDVSSNDEWIKLKNITSDAVDLSGWQVLDKDEQIKVILTGQIDDFYLLERTDDTSVPDVAADIIYTGALNNTNEAVYLFDDNCVLQDRVIADPDWPSDDVEIDDVEIDDVGAGFPSPEDPEDPEDPEEPNEDEGGETPPLQSVIINEIAWMGTKVSANDEWIELYNPQEESVDISGWQLIFQPLSGTPKITEFSVSGVTTPIIDGLSYFLIERTNDETVSDVPADYIFTGALNNDGGVFELRDNNNNLIDKVDCSQGWLAGNNDGKISMEKDGDAWRNNNLIIHNGNNIWGTPRAKNSVVQETLIIGSLSFGDNEFDKITLSNQSGKYIVRNNIAIPENKTLIIDPGVTLNFYDEYSGLTINGTLTAIGEEDDKITFTSVKDPLYAGAWDGIYFEGVGANNSEINNIILEYAGGNKNRRGFGLEIKDSSINIQNSLFEGNRYSGIHLINSDSLIDNVEFSKTGTNDANYGSIGLWIEGGSPTIQSSLFKNNSYGSYVDSYLDKSAKPTFKNNTFEENETVIKLTEASFYGEGNILVNNGLEGVLVMGNFTEDAVLQSDLSYIVRNNVSVISKLTLEPGTVVKFYDKYSSFIVPGTLNAIGTESDKITFTSSAEVGLRQTGDWGKISLSPAGTAELDNIILEYGGGMFNWPGIEVNQAELSLKNSIIRFNKNAGISLINNATAIFDGVQFNDNKCNISENDRCINP